MTWPGGFGRLEPGDLVGLSTHSRFHSSCRSTIGLPISRENRVSDAMMIYNVMSRSQSRITGYARICGLESD
jgi:hypothetical protein